MVDGFAFSSHGIYRISHAPKGKTLGKYGVHSRFKIILLHGPIAAGTIYLCLRRSKINVQRRVPVVVELFQDRLILVLSRQNYCLIIRTVSVPTENCDVIENGDPASHVLVFGPFCRCVCAAETNHRARWLTVGPSVSNSWVVYANVTNLPAAVSDAKQRIKWIIKI